MNEENLRNRLKAADPAAQAPLLSESVVVEATLKGKSAPIGFRAARLSLAGAAAAVLAIGLTLPSALAPQPLFTLAGAGPTGNQPGALSATSETADAKMIWPGWIQYNYIADGLSEQAGRGVVYEIRKVGDPLEILKRVADYFGIEGTPKEDDWSTKEFPSYSISGDNFYLSVYWSGAGYWNFGRWTNQVLCAEPIEGEGASTKECIPPQSQPDLIPTKPELIEQTITTFAALGIEVSEEQLTVQRDEWGAYVTVSNSHKGQPIPIDFYIAWDFQGKISSISAASFEIVERGEFGTVSPVDAVARIKDGRWYGGVSSKYYEQYYRPIGIARSTDAAVALPAPEEGEAEQPVEPVEPEIVDLRINKSEAVLVSVFDSSGNMWLVPGYLLFNDQGWFDSIVSLEEGVIQLPEPVDVMPLQEETKN
jgi:hypothetical protein